MTKRTENPGTLVASEIMTPNVMTLSPETSIPEGIHELLVRQFSEMPVVDKDGAFRGMFSEKCCMRVLASLVDLAPVPIRRAPTAADVMVPRSKLLTLSPDRDVHTAMELLFQRNCSGAPVIDSNDRFLGIFSEKTCMGFVIEAAYNNLPGATVREFIDSDSNRLIDADTDLHDIARIFMDVPYGRLPVMDNKRIIGQLSRRDVLQYSGVLACIMKHHLPASSTVHVAPLPEEIEVWSRVRDVLPDYTVSEFMNDASQTIDTGMNLFSIARLFMVSAFRRFPVINDNRLVGQISRCDLLREILRVTCQ
ncbi:MAG: CBS domain-containing protein [Planctomycetaceae bacterium]